MKSGEQTVIGRGTKLRGYISSEDDLQISGELEGTIRISGGCLTINEGAHVRATIGAQDIVIMGRVEGEIHATGRVELRPTAVVVGDVFAAHLSIEENATLHGSVDPMRAGEAVPPPAAMPPVAMPPLKADRAPATSPAARTPVLVDPQTGGGARSAAQMPSALRSLADAAAGAREATAADGPEKSGSIAAEPKP